MALEDKKQEERYDVAIIGAGVVGAMLARELMRYKLKVLLLESDSDVAMGQTKANSAIVHGGYAESNATLKGRLCYQGRKAFPKLEEELEFGFDPCGSLVVAFQDEDKDELLALRDNGIKNGIPKDEFELWDQEKIRLLVPGISSDAKLALFCRGAGICSPYVLTIALVENAIKNGLVLKLNEGLKAAKRIPEEDLFQLRSTTDDVYYAKRVVNAAGLGGESVAALFGVEGVDLYGRSGEYLLLDRGTDELIPYVLFGMPTAMGKGILLSRTVHGNLIIGPDASELSDMEVDEAAIRGLDTHEERLLAIWQQANDLFPNLPAAKIVRDFAGVRSAARGKDFLIGPDPSKKIRGYFQAVGIQSPGLTAAPAIAELLIEHMQEDGLVLEEDPNFDPKRKAYIRPLESASFPANGTTKRPLDRATLEALLKLDEGEEGRMVCRCEQVTEEAVLASLDQGIEVTTVDAVKRRSRAGMGQCQGMYCRSRVASLLAMHLGLTLAEVDDRTDVEMKDIKRVGANRLKRLIRESDQK